MNNKLLTALTRPLTNDNRQEIVRIIRESRPFDGEALSYLDDEVIIRAINMAAVYVANAAESVSKYDDPERRWENIMGAQTITENLTKLLKNPALLSYTQAILVIGWALQKPTPMQTGQMARQWDPLPPGALPLPEE